MFEYFWTDESRTNVIRVDDAGNVVAFFPDDEGYADAVSKVTGVASIIDRETPMTADEAREHRDELLAVSDWTQVSDAPVDQAAWAIYRQALRDIPDQEGFPSEIAWPTQP